MIDEKILITSKDEDMSDALNKIDENIKSLNLGQKDSLHLRLVAEEMLGMMNSLTGRYRAFMWFERSVKEAKVYLTAKTDNMHIDTKKELLSVSTTGKNESTKGFMGKIGDIIENGLYSMDEVGQLQTRYGGGTVMYGAMGMVDPEALNAGSLAYAWSLEQYRQSVGDDMQEKEELSEAWDELEKSIVASIADNVSVSVKGGTVEMVIEKKNG